MSTKRVAIACVRGWEGRAEAVGTAGLPYTRLLVESRRTVMLAKALAAEQPPAYVLVEQPGGRSVSPQLWYAVGAAFCGLVEGLELAGMNPAFDTVTVGGWKKEAGLGGGADKEDIAAWARKTDGWVGSQDEADALGVATCAWLRFVAQNGGVSVVP